MAPFGPIKRRDLIRALQALDFEGTYSGGRHQYMVKGELKLYPNLHGGEIRRALLSRILKKGGTTRSGWEDI